MMTSDEKEIWLSFVAALEKVQTSSANQSDRRNFASEHKAELLLISFWLNQLQITGGELHIAADPPEVCDLCGVDLSVNGLFIDGQIADGRWSFMCPACYGVHGVGIGWGIGQLYRLIPQGKNEDLCWVSIAGSDPSPGGLNKPIMA